MKKFVREIPLNKYKETSIKDDFDELCKIFGKTFPENNEIKNNEKKEKENPEEIVDLRFDKYVKLRDYEKSFEKVFGIFIKKAYKFLQNRQ